VEEALIIMCLGGGLMALDGMGVEEAIIDSSSLVLNSESLVDDEG
jgi:hypothetical protein